MTCNLWNFRCVDLVNGLTGYSYFTYVLRVCYINDPQKRVRKENCVVLRHILIGSAIWSLLLLPAAAIFSPHPQKISRPRLLSEQCSDRKKEIEETWRVRETSPCKFTPASSVPPRTCQSTLLPTFMVHCPMDCVHWAAAVRWKGAQGNSNNKCCPTDGSLWKQNNYKQTKINESSQNQCNALFKLLNVDKLSCGGCELWSVSI